jgi:hypothetical protein
VQPAREIKSLHFVFEPTRLHKPIVKIKAQAQLQGLGTAAKEQSCRLPVQATGYLQLLTAN